MNEYENIEDFEGKSFIEINAAKEKMYNDILNTEIVIEKDMDVKKAYELIKSHIKSVN